MPVTDVKSFADCVAKNKGKVKNPRAYCASLMKDSKSKFTSDAVKMARVMNGGK